MRIRSGNGDLWAPWLVPVFVGLWLSGASACGQSAGATTDASDEVAEAPPDLVAAEAPEATRDGIAPDSASADSVDSVDSPSSVDGEVACRLAADCASGFCVQGVCCDRACDGLCEFCPRASSDGSGTCMAVPAGMDPRDDCQADGAATCGRSGVCDGKGGCSLYPENTLCHPPACSGMQLLLTAGVCDGRGRCAQGRTVDCAPYACTHGACESACSEASKVNGTCPAGRDAAADSVPDLKSVVDSASLGDLPGFGQACRPILQQGDPACAPGLVCISVGLEQGRNLCTKTCTTEGAPCADGPGGSKPACGREFQLDPTSSRVCEFFCDPNAPHCPSGTSCLLETSGEWTCQPPLR